MLGSTNSASVPSKYTSTTGPITCEICPIICDISNLLFILFFSIPIEKIVYVPVKDTINEQENIAKIIRLEYELSLYKDSLNYIRDSLGQDLFIANYKLAKIKEYNRLAGNGNNIKFLRGWINRTLNE